jgi:Ca2+-binding RTX toxin-like protein
VTTALAEELAGLPARLVVASGAAGDIGPGVDYVDGGDGADVLSGGRGADQVVGGPGDDIASGEGADTTATGTETSSVADRLLDCATTTRVVGGLLDLNGDLLSGPTSLTDVVPDDGRAAGFAVADGAILAPASGTAYTGLIGGDVVVIGGAVDLDRDGDVDGDDTGTIDLASMRFDTSAVSDGDCILAGEGSDLLRGGRGADYLGSGDGTDLAEGGDGADVLLGDAGTDVLLGGPNSDVLVGGDDDDHLVGQAGEDRLRGNDGDDALIGGSETNAATDGQDVLLAGRGDDVLVAENGTVVGVSVTAAVAAAPWRASALVPASTGAGNAALRFAGSAVACGTATATRWVTLRPGASGEVRTPTASPGTPVAYDELYGGYDCDFVFGSPGDDIVRGGQDDDVVEGGPGADLAQGDAGSDVVVGGSTTSRSIAAPVTITRVGTGTSDSDDTILGDGGPDGEVGADLLAGDNATPVRRADGTYDITLWDVSTTSTVTGGNDTLYGADVALTSGADRDRIFGQGGNDAAYAGSDVDYVEGNVGDDRLLGGAGDDDIIGGSSSNLGKPTADSRLTLAVSDLDASAANVLDGADQIEGGTGNDVALGDNGRITRPTTPVSTSPAPAYRDVAMADTTAGTTSGSDRIVGDAGDDVLYGQLDDATTVLGTGDRVEGGADQDALLGDLGVVTVTAATALPGPRTVTDNSGMIVETLYDPASWVPVTALPAKYAATGGQDVLLGDSGNDVLRGGGGRDLANGGTGDDTLFGGDGDDAVWGGTGHDRLFGGYGADDLDLKARASDPAVYATLNVIGLEDRDNRISTTNGPDLVYGGWGPDELQADQGDAGPTPGSDQLLDWVGNHNVYYVCNGAYGAGRTIRESSPDLMTLLTDVATAGGATALTTSSSGGWFDLGMVTNADKNSNTKPTPGAPGNFTCEAAG